MLKTLNDTNYNTSLEIVRLFLEKIEKLNERERSVITDTIDTINHPTLIYDPNTTS